eukprot:scaffold20937_cov56-Phaeocystis_antarctica.AAC.3
MRRRSSTRLDRLRVRRGRAAGKHERAPVPSERLGQQARELRVAVRDVPATPARVSQRRDDVRVEVGVKG